MLMYDINSVQHGMRELKKYQLHKMGVKLLCPRIKFSGLLGKGQKQLRLLDFRLSALLPRMAQREFQKHDKDIEKTVNCNYKQAKKF